MQFDVEIVLKERDHAITERIEHGTDPGAWSERDVESILKQILLAIDRAKHPSQQHGRHVVLRGFSWIVEPAENNQVVIAIEIPMGAAIAGPFAIGQTQLDGMISRVLRAEAPDHIKQTIH